MAADSVISLAERLKQRREELGITQSQAARELDVARTAYRLWELEAAKPAPDRWRLIASWLGVSVTTMLLAEDLLTDEEAAQSNVVEFDFARTGRDWDLVGAGKPGDFFAQARGLLEDGVRSGDITQDQAAGLQVLFDRMDATSPKAVTGAWEAAELRKLLPADELAPRHARDAMSAAGVGLPEDDLETARLLMSELVTNSVRHGPTNDDATVGVFIGVGRDRLRVEVSDGATEGARPRSPSEDGGYGLALVAALATRWGAGREGGMNVTWFELDLRSPGS
jgi:transcriptional regulator with XRE-family HTH domain/anti-sigma regulatory factor (Ser/Thr protein kinase)